jgi:aldehyde dehydrogenase (NAD+)
VQEAVYPEFLKRFTAVAQALEAATGDPFALETRHGPQVSQTQFDVRYISRYIWETVPNIFLPQRIMGYIDSGKKDGATLHLGGRRQGTEGYFIEPTIFTDCKPEMKVVREEIFGPVAVIIKFKDEAGMLHLFLLPMQHNLSSLQRSSNLRMIPFMDSQALYFHKTLTGLFV